MRIKSLQISNFRSIRFLELTELNDMVVIAGTNGCGKSSIFNAIRLLKSAYGEYHQNEWQQWFQEFQIDVNKLARDVQSVLFDPSLPVRISAQFRISEIERQYLSEKAPELLQNSNWQRLYGRRIDPTIGAEAVIPPQDKARYSEEIDAQTKAMLAALRKHLAEEDFKAELTITPDGQSAISPSPVMELMLSSFNPERLGIIDYHGSHRVYARQNLSSVNLQLRGGNQHYGQHALYNTQNKYANIKTQMASEYVNQLIAKEAGEVLGDSDIIETLKVMFREFFPGKDFLGPTPHRDGRLEFKVKLANGRTHDIDELSSGEKEVLLGYLRLRSDSPRNSIILIDEPELHLNPKMIHGLVGFYRKHVGQALGNQIWLITHSDALIRDAVNEKDASCYHMQPGHVTPNEEEQLTKLDVRADLESVVFDLVGDLATYAPRSRVVLLEGGGSTEFDLKMITALFPEFAERVNLVSANSKAKVRHLHEVLDRVASGGLDVTFFSIVDLDFDEPNWDASTKHFRRFTWNRYHIENYLLDGDSIVETVNALELTSPRKLADIEQMLKECAEETVDEIVRHNLTNIIETEIRSCRPRRAVEDTANMAINLHNGVKKAKMEIEAKLSTVLSAQSLAEKETDLRSRFNSALENAEWKAIFPARPILKRFTSRLGSGIRYEVLRNSILQTMKKNEHQPTEMQEVIDQIR